jgi:hypothetical protein
MKITGGEPSVRRTPAELSGKASPGELAGQKAVRAFPALGEKPAGLKAPLSTLSGLLASLKMPQDNLSRSVIAFARFFNLPLEPKTLTTLRREALNQPLREASALGAAAAADKGLELPAGALKEYAAAINGNREFGLWQPEGNPEEAGKNSGEGGPGGGSGDSGNPQGEAPNDGASMGGGRGGFSGEKDRDRDADPALPPLADIQTGIKAMLAEKPVLDLINRIPGKNGRQWVVLPFSFNQGGVEFTVSLRLLLGWNAPGAERLCADIKVSRPEKEQKRWIITLEKQERAQQDSIGDLQAEISVFSGDRPGNFTNNEEKRLERELAQALGLPLDKVTAKTETRLFNDSREDLLRPVDEEV